MSVWRHNYGKCYNFPLKNNYFLAVKNLNRKIKGYKTAFRFPKEKYAVINSNFGMSIASERNKLKTCQKFKKYLNTSGLEYSF